MLLMGRQEPTSHPPMYPPNDNQKASSYLERLQKISQTTEYRQLYTTHCLWCSLAVAEARAVPPVGK